MSNMIQTVTSGLRTFFELVGRANLRRRLLRFDERTLEDMGFSRELLEAGVGAWPWRLAAETSIGYIGNYKPYRKSFDYRQAVRELHAYSDAELADLGLHRSGIEYAVRNGRPGIDDRDQAAA